ncbi:hypothetical protein U9M48_008337 [Paspalum notatum var. saurae]|uniref:Uncharacterized protein n=1 Tax=Paspalum notatum var. saurae TaxID=547442 RepID=A0AAQ3SP08_PASNO
MDNVLIDRSASGFEFRRGAPPAADDCRMSALPPHTHYGIYSGSFVPPYASPLPAPLFQYVPYLHSSLSLPPLPPRRRQPPLPLQPRFMTTTMASKYAVLPPPPAGKPVAHQAGPAATAPRRTGLIRESSYNKSKKPRTPRPVGEEPPRALRRKPLERATPLPPTPAVDEALDDLEREVTGGFVQDLVHALAPPPSSLPLPTFSLVRAAAVKAAASCAV